MQKLLILIHSLDGGGAERVVWRLANHWAANRTVEVHIAVIKPRFAYPSLPDTEIHVLGKEQNSLLGKLCEQPALLTRFRALVKDIQPDCVFSLMPRSNMLAALSKDCLKAGARLVLSERTSFEMQYTGVSRALINCAYRTLYPRADAVIAVSQGVANELTSRGLRKDKVFAIPNPCDQEQLEALSRQDVPPAHPWLTDPSIPVFLSVGRYAPEKGFATLLQAFRLVLQERPARLLIMGKGPLEPELAAEIRRLGVEGSAALVPFANNPFPVIRQATAYVLSSRAEGFPNALMEALALGKPCAAFDCQWGPRELLEGHDCGILVAPQGDVAALAQAMTTLIADQKKAATYGENAKKRVQDFSLPSIARRYERVLFNK